MAKYSSPLAFLLICSLFFLSYNTCSSFPADHKQALLQFKSLLVGKINRDSSPDTAFFDIESWNSGSNCCQWMRVTCDAHLISQPVVDLNLSMVVFYGRLPAFVLMPRFHIKNLVRFDISSDSLQGEIPADGLANLTQLVYLDMRSNNFNSSIPSQLFHLRVLQYLDLSGNLLRGKLSGDVGMFRSLRYLDLDENFLNGEIPMEIGNLSKLWKLSLGQNRFSGRIPLPILKLRELRMLDLRNNHLSSEIPVDIGNLTTFLLWL